MRRRVILLRAADALIDRLPLRGRKLNSRPGHRVLRRRLRVSNDG